MSTEAALSLWAAWTAHSPALAAFGGDSAVELLSAVVVLWRFRTHASERAEQVAARIAGGLLFVLAAYVVLASAMSMLGYNEEKPSYLGMAVLVGGSAYHASACQGKAASISPDRQCCSESRCCRVRLVRIYLSIIALMGLAIHAIWQIAWADPVAARNHAAHCVRGSESHARQGLWLLLGND